MVADIEMSSQRARAAISRARQQANAPTRDSLRRDLAVVTRPCRGGGARLEVRRVGDVELQRLGLAQTHEVGMHLLGVGCELEKPLAPLTSLSRRCKLFRPEARFELPGWLGRSPRSQPSASVACRYEISARGWEQPWSGPRRRKPRARPARARAPCPQRRPSQRGSPRPAP